MHSYEQFRRRPQRFPDEKDALEDMVMAEREPTQEPGTNWAVVGLGVIVMMLVNLALADLFLRAMASAIIMLAAVFWSQSRPEPDVENPLLDQLHDVKQHGLDRRKYGHLRSSTNNLLDHVRQMNRIAVEGREGKLAPRHAQAELDRLASKMRDVVDDIRKTAGVPTPDVASSREAPAKPDVVIPKAAPEQPEPAAAAEPQPAAPAPAPEPPRESDETLDDLEARAKAEAHRRQQEGGS